MTGRTTEVSERIAERIVTIRRKRGMSQPRLAAELARLGHGWVTTMVLSAIESGRRADGRRRKLISVDELVAVAEAFGMTPSDLLEGTSCEACNGEPPIGFTCNTCGAQRDSSTAAPD